MKTSLLVTAVVISLFCGQSALALCDFTLFVDVDRTAYLWNTSDKDISFDGYQIVSESKGLDVAGWDSISDRFPGRLTELMDSLGAGAVAFGELNPNASQIAEGNLTGVGVLKAGAKFSIGKPFPSLEMIDQGISFFTKVSGNPNSLDACIVVAPEPSSLGLAALGSVLVLGRFRRWRKLA